MFGLGFNEILIIGGIIVVFFYGSDKLVEFAKSAGKLTGEYRKGKLAADKEVNDIKKKLGVK
jgi:Sec-independent protein translocase protein TatA